MSKAFTKEDDQQDDLEEEKGPALPGGKNYITPQGARRLQDELKQLRTKERPEVCKIVSWAAGNGDRSENGDYTYNKRRLREIDRRMRYLGKRLQSAEVVDPLLVACDQVMFGATVTIADENDNQRTYSIVGVDEVDLAKSRISWISPLGSALLKAREGDIVQFRSPKGLQEVEIVKIEYKNLD